VALLACIVLLSTWCLYALCVVVGAVPDVLNLPGSKTCSSHQIRNAQVSAAWRPAPNPIRRVVSLRSWAGASWKN
jgi:hypothetical protein